MLLLSPEIIEVEKPKIEAQKIEVKADEIKYYKGNICVVEKEVTKKPLFKAN